MPRLEELTPGAQGNKCDTWIYKGMDQVTATNNLRDLGPYSSVSGTDFSVLDPRRPDDQLHQLFYRVKHDNWLKVAL